MRVVNEAECQRWEGRSSDRSIHNRISDLTRRSLNQVETFGQNSDARIHAGSNIQQPSDWGQIYRVATVNRTR